jgi:hypothetical protein
MRQHRLAWLTTTTTILVVLLLMAGAVSGQAPLSAQIQRALRNISTLGIASTGTLTFGGDTTLARGAGAGTIKLTAATTTNTFSIANGSNLEVGAIGWSGNNFRVGTIGGVNGGTARDTVIGSAAGAANGIYLATEDTSRWQIASTGLLRPMVDNAYDIGDATHRIRTLYAAAYGPSSSKASYPAQTTTVRTIKGTAGTLMGYYIYNPNAAVAYVQFFDVASATPVTLGTTVPDLTYGIPATAGANLISDTGITFTNGIKMAVTTTATGLTAPGTGLDVNIYYQ